MRSFTQNIDINLTLSGHFLKRNFSEIVGDYTTIINKPFSQEYVMYKTAYRAA